MSTDGTLAERTVQRGTEQYLALVVVPLPYTIRPVKRSASRSMHGLMRLVPAAAAEITAVAGCLHRSHGA